MQFADFGTHRADGSLHAAAGAMSIPVPGKELAMQITFPDTLPEYSSCEHALCFAALVDGEPVECRVTLEALEDHYGAASPHAEDMLGAFGLQRPRIEAAVRRLLTETHAQCVELRSGYVRFFEAYHR